MRTDDNTCGVKCVLRPAELKNFTATQCVTLPHKTKLPRNKSSVLNSIKKFTNLVLCTDQGWCEVGGHTEKGALLKGNLGRCGALRRSLKKDGLVKRQTP